MFDWIKNINKEHPEFWKKYLQKFETKSKRYVVISAETTGLNPKKDVILSLGAIAVEKEMIVINDSFEIVIPQYKFLHDNGMSNAFISESSLPKLPEPKAIEEFINFIGNATLVGHRIHFDVQMLNEALDKLDCGRIKNEALDVEIMHQKLYDITGKTFAIDELLKAYKISQTDRVSALDDAYSIAILFLKLKSKLGF